MHASVAFQILRGLSVLFSLDIFRGNTKSKLNSCQAAIQEKKSVLVLSDPVNDITFASAFHASS